MSLKERAKLKSHFQVAEKKSHLKSNKFKNKEL